MSNRMLRPLLVESRFLTKPLVDRLNRADRGNSNRDRTGDGGFILLESIVSIGLITILMTAMTTFLITTTRTTNHLRIRQEAIQLADSAIDRARSFPPASLVANRTGSAVDQQLSLPLASNPVLAPVLATVRRVSDPSSSPGGFIEADTTASCSPVVASYSTTLPTLPLCQTVGTRRFNTSYFLGQCYLATAGNNTCGTTVPSTPYVTYLRVVVAVSWANPCPDSSCIYVTSTLINADANAIAPTRILANNQFSVAAPNQVSYIGEQVPPLPSAITPLGGVEPLAWAASGLTALGLTMTPSGAFSGTIVDPGAAYNVVNFPVTLSVWDGFIRKATGGDFTWTVWRNPSITAATKNAIINTPASLDIKTVSTCPRSPCTYSISAPLPGTPAAKLTIDPNTGILSGTSTVLGQSTIAVTITDASGLATHSATASVTWNVLVAATVCVNEISLQNGSFEAPVVAHGAPNWQVGGSSPLLWDTTEPDNVIELWKNDGAGAQASFTAQKSNGGKPVTAEDGTQWAELNANQTGALYQNIPTVSGQVLQWSVWHRGRYSTAANAATKKDIMQVEIGTVAKQTVQVPTGQTSTDIADGPDGWNLYRGIYVVPDGQTTTRFQFAAVSTASGSNSIGNFIDNLALDNYVACLANLPGDQTSTVSTTISPLQLSAIRGSGHYSWGGGATLPAGLRITPDGLITGTPTAAGNSHVTLTLTDTQTTFVQSVSFDWLVVKQPSVTAPPTQRSTSGATVSLTLSTSCSNAPCSYGLNNAPAGLAISDTGLITGTVTSAAQNFDNVTVNIRDKQGAAASSAAFTWVVSAKQSVTAPTDQLSSVGSTVSFAVTASCPAAPCSYALKDAPSGVTINAAGVVSGTITAAAGSYPAASISLTDANGFVVASGTFGWTVNPAPALLSPGNQTTPRAGTVNLAMASFASGGTGAYSYRASGLPSWLALNATNGTLTGTAPTADSSTTPITITLTDATGATSTTPAFSWTVSNALTLGFASQTSYRSATVNLDLHTYTTGGTGAYTYIATGLPSWLSLNSSTGTLTGTAPSVAVNSTTNTSNIKITVQDGVGATAVVSGLNWYVTDLTWASQVAVTTPLSTNVKPYDASTYVSGGSGIKTYSATQLPPGLSMSATGVLRGTVSAKGTWMIKLAVTDGVGAVAPSTLAWTVT